jgi:hypothetical protein
VYPDQTVGSAPVFEPRAQIVLRLPGFTQPPRRESVDLINLQA